MATEHVPQEDPGQESHRAALRAVVDTKAKLLDWADKHDASHRGPWRLLGALAAGAAGIVIARAILPRRSTVRGAERGVAPSMGRAARPLMRLMLAGKVGYWLWTHLPGRAGRSIVAPRAVSNSRGLDGAAESRRPEARTASGQPPPGGRPLTDAGSKR